MLQAYSLKLAERLGRAFLVFLYWKGRVALYALIQAMGVRPKDEVILPAYTCVVVPNAILYAGAIPVYVDVQPDTYCLDIDRFPGRKRQEPYPPGTFQKPQILEISPAGQRPAGLSGGRRKGQGALG